MGNVFDDQLMAIADDQVKRANVAIETMLGGKTAFVDAQDTQGPGGGAPPPGDPGAAGGGGGAGGGDPMAAMGPGAMDPLAGGGGAGLTEDRVRQMIQESMAVQGGGAAGAGGAGGAGALGPNGMPKKKVDVNTEIYHVKRLLVAMMNYFKIPISPDILLGDPAEDPYAAPGEAARDPASAGAAPGVSAIPPIQPMQGASPAMAAGAPGGAGGAGGMGGDGGEKMSAYHDNGDPISSQLVAMSTRSSAIAELIRQSHGQG